MPAFGKQILRQGVFFKEENRNLICLEAGKKIMGTADLDMPLGCVRQTVAEISYSPGRAGQ